MMDWTDRHCRFFHRLLAPSALLYTEMIHAGAVLHGDRDRLLAFDRAEHPVALQLGGSAPAQLAEAARIACEAYGYDEVNLNCGCPSERVRKGAFGACLMREPQLVADCVAAMRDAAAVAVTVKCRIGVDRSGEDLLWRFVETVSAAGCQRFVVHAREAWLQGLSPKENREIPPLRHEVVRALKAAFPHLAVVANGGIADPASVPGHLRFVDGVMIGREAYQNPWSLVAFEAAATGRAPARGRAEVVARMHAYAAAATAQGVPLSAVTRHMLGLFNGLKGARAWRRLLAEKARLPGASADLLLVAARAVETPAPLAA